MLTVAEILAAIEQLPTREQQELSQVVLNLPINNQTEDRVDRRALPDDAQASTFWERVERFRALLQTVEIDVNEIWEDVRVGNKHPIDITPNPLSSSKTLDRLL